MDATELRAALRATAPYLLSHHEPAAYDRCYAPAVRGRRVRLCARCLGIYPGVAAGLLAWLAGPPLPTAFALVAILPAAALLDWAVTTFTQRAGLNAVRTATGGLLGYAYGLGLARLAGFDLRVLAVGVAYGVVAAALLALAARRDE